MEILVDGGVMRAYDRAAIEYFGVHSLVLMERAALAVVDEIVDRASKFDSLLVVCGTGNNGGDGFAIARILHLKGFLVDVVLVGDEGKFTEETHCQWNSCLKYGVPVWKEVPDKKYQFVVDCLFGIGVSRDLEGVFKSAVEGLNRLEGFKIAVDIPSGVNADSGEIMGAAFLADLTVTFAFQKVGNVLFPGKYYAGNCVVRDIGITDDGVQGAASGLFYLSNRDLKRIKKREARSNKGSFGRVLVIAGCKNMAGAAFLSGSAAYASGCGLVELFTDEANRVILQSLLPEAVLTTFQEDFERENFKRLLLDSISKADVIVLGPGLSQSDIARFIVEFVLENSGVPVVLDADGINVVAHDLKLLVQKKGDVIVTPHLKEMGRLCKMEVADIQKDIIGTARGFARLYDVVCVLKDARTITALPGQDTFVNLSGNNGMAVGGAGDVLTGIIAGFLAQGMGLAESAYLGVFVHGLAGDKAAINKGAYSMVARDIVDGICDVLIRKDVE